MGVAEAIEAVRQFGVVHTEAGHLLIEADRKHTGAPAAHLKVSRRGKTQALAMLEAEVLEPSQATIDSSAGILN